MGAMTYQALPTFSVSHDKRHIWKDVLEDSGHYSLQNGGMNYIFF